MPPRRRSGGGEALADVSVRNMLGEKVGFTRPICFYFRVHKLTSLIAGSLIFLASAVVSPGLAFAKTPASTNDLNLGSVPVGTTSGLLLTLTNLGATPVTVSNVTFPEGFVGGFLGTIEPGATANFSILFRPTAITNYEGLVTIRSDATDPALVVLTPNANFTNSPDGITEFSVTGAGVYPTGKFEGLFMPTNDLAVDNCGYFVAHSTARGKILGTIILAGKRYPFSAPISLSSTASATINRKKQPPLNLSLQFGRNSAGWWGTIDGGTWTADVMSEPAPLLTKQSLREVPAGRYTLTLAGSTNAAIAPTASGTGRMSIAISDATHLTATLGDGTRFSQNNILCTAHLPVYASLYGHRGAILGWIGFPQPLLPPPHLVEAAPSASPQLEIGGTLFWLKPAGIDRGYPAGFSFQTTVTGSVP